MAADDAPQRHADDARRRLAAIRASLVREIEQRVARLSTIGGELSADRAALDNARRIKAEVIALLRDDALPVVLSVAEVKADEAADAALRGFLRSSVGEPLGAGVDVSTEPQARASIARSVSGVLDEVATVFGEGEQAMRAAIDVGLSTGSSLVDVIEGVRQAIDTTFVKASTAVDAAVRAAGTQALVMQAERGAEAVGVEVGYLYDGPRDGKMREFCREHVGVVYTLDALRRLDNGMGLPVDKYLGGFGCRHRLSPIDLDDAVAAGLEVLR